MSHNDADLDEVLPKFYATMYSIPTLFNFLDWLVKEGWINTYDWREDSPKHQKVK